MNALTTIASITTDPVLADNLAAYARQADGAFARSTMKAIKADAALFAAWCIAAGHCCLPAPPATVAAFVRAMAALKKPASIRRYVASIGHLHRAAKVPNPCRGEKEVQLALKALNRERGRAQKQALPMTHDLVAAALRPVPAHVRLPVRDLRNRAILAVAYNTLYRASEMVALRVEDIQRDVQDGSAVITVRRSKSDQEVEGMVRYLARDTMVHVTAWLTGAGIGQGPLFRAVLKGGVVADRPLHVSDITRTFREVAPKAGRITVHSTRVGASVDTVAAGVDIGGVMQAGGWKSPTMVGRCTRALDAKQGDAAKLAVKQGRELERKQRRGYCFS